MMKLSRLSATILFLLCNREVLSIPFQASSVAAVHCDYNVYSHPFITGISIQDALDSIEKHRMMIALDAQLFSLVTLCLHAGVHVLTAPLTMNSYHSNLSIIGLPASNIDVVVSGGISLTPKDMVACPRTTLSFSKNWWCYKAPSDAQSRHLYVDDIRATRLSAAPEVLAAFTNSPVVTNDGYMVSLNSYPVLAGWVAGNTSSVSADGVKEIEFVFTGEGPSPWTESRCTVKNTSLVDNDMLFVAMEQPCFTILRNKPCSQGVSLPTSIENVPPSFATDMRTITSETLAPTPSLFWYLFIEDNGDKTIMINKKSEPLKVVMPTLEVLLSSTSSSNVTLSDISFMHATWLRPSSGLGFVEQQSGALVSSASYDKSSCDDTEWSPMPSNLIFTSGESIVINNCNFKHLGAGGVQLQDGTHDSIISNCVFEDISGTAVQIGGYNDPTEVDESKQERNNTVSECTIVRVAVEFKGSCGVQVCMILVLFIYSPFTNF